MVERDRHAAQANPKRRSDRADGCLGGLEHCPRRLARGGLAACGRVAQRPERYPSAPARIPRSRRGEPRWSIEQNDLHSDALQKSRLRDANALDHKPALESRAYRLERLPAIGVRGRTKDFSKLLVVRL